MSTSATSNYTWYVRPPWPECAAFATAVISVALAAWALTGILNPQAVLLLLCFAGILAGISSSYVGRFSEQAVPHVVRIGARCSLLAVVVGGALLIGIIRWRWGQFPAFTVTAMVLPSVLPAALCGTVAATLTAMRTTVRTLMPVFTLLP